MIKLNQEQQERFIFLNNCLGKRILKDTERGEQEFLYLLFKYQEEGKTKQQLKEFINKLYTAKKQIQEANQKGKSLNNYLIDMYAIYDILQSSRTTQNTFFNLSYSYLKN